MNPTGAFLADVGLATPPHAVHAAFVAYARSLLRDERERLVFDRMAERSGIEERQAVLAPGRLEAGEVDAGGLYRPGRFPGTHERMQRYEAEALPLAVQAVRDLERRLAERAAGHGPSRGLDLPSVTHLIAVSCTGFVAPGLDVGLIDALGLSSRVQRTVVGFMGCSAALPALRLAQQTVRCDPDARVLVVNVELCSLHLQESRSIEELLSFLLFGDAASATLVSAEPWGAELLDFATDCLSDSRGHITWRIGDGGFVMHLSGAVPGRINEALQGERQAGATSALLRGVPAQAYAHWVVHAGGRSILDAVERGLALAPEALAHSRQVLREIGNVSSVTVLAVMRRLLGAAPAPGLGLAMAFGPGLTAESMRFRLAQTATGGTHAAPLREGRR